MTKRHLRTVDNLVVLSPSSGWYSVGGAVWDNANYGGLRIHTGGYCVLPATGKFIGADWPESQLLDCCIEICGGSRRRGVMIWAMNLIEAGLDVNS